MTIEIAIIRADMVGKAHTAAYRVASAFYESTSPDLRYVFTGDTSAGVGRKVIHHCDYECSDTNWQAITDGPDIQVVSVVIVDSLYLEAVKGLIEAGKHVLCGKPLPNTLTSAWKMTDPVRKAFSVVRIDFTYYRQPPPGYTLIGDHGS